MHLPAFLHVFTFWTALDMALCALVLRLVAGWLIGNPRLARLLVILLCLAGFFAAVQRANLPVTQVLTDALVLPAAFLAVFNFLPDLRRAYQAATLRQIFAKPRGGGNDPLPALASALADLARLRRGVLLVFPQGDDFDVHLNGGEEYDALVTKSLLLSLSHPDCPRHDGAIVIRRDRVVRVGAVLPLSETDGLREEWGTRHLAALGLSERCDADVVAVSEERGTVTHARGGEMREIAPLTAEALEKFLRAILRPAAPSRVRGLAGRAGLGAWALALGIALVAVPAVHWLNRPAHESRTSDLMVSPQVPVTLTNVPENLYLQTNDDLHVQLTLRAPNNSEEGRAVPEVALSVDLKGYPAGTFTVPYTARMVSNLPPGWEVERCVPGQIHITLLAARDARFRIQPRFAGLPKGMRIASVAVVPADVAVRVRDSDPLTRVLETLPIDLSAVRKPGFYPFPAVLDLPPTVQVRTVAAPRVTVEIAK